MMYRELVQKLSDYLAGSLSLQDLELWLLARLQDYLDSGDLQLAQSAGDLDAMIAELKEGIVSEATFRQHVYAVVCPTGQLLHQTISNASSSTITKKEKLLGKQWVSEDLVTVAADR